MKITSFSLCGFRNMGQTVINLKSITALVSLNSYGKSNLFSALDFALTFMRASSELRRNMMGNVSFMPLNVNLDDSDFIFSIEGDYEEKENAYTVHYGFSFEWAKDCDKGARITSEELYIRDKKAKSHKKPLLQRDANGIRIRSSMTGRCSTKISKDLSDTELALDFLKVSSPDYMEGIVQSIAGIRACIDEQLDASSLYHQIPQIVFHNNDGNQTLFENIPRSLFLLKQKEPVRYNSLIDIFTSLFPNITGVEILESDISKDLKNLVEKDAPFTVSPKIYSLWVKDRNMNQPLDFRFLSAGAKRILRRKTSKRKAGGHLGTTPDGLLCHCLFIISPKTGSYKSLPIGPQDPNFPVKVDPLFFLYDKPLIQHSLKGGADHFLWSSMPS